MVNRKLLTSGQAGSEFTYPKDPASTSGQAGSEFTYPKDPASSPHRPQRTTSLWPRGQPSPGPPTVVAPLA